MTFSKLTEMKRNINYLFILMVQLVFLAGCDKKLPIYTGNGQDANINPDYSSVFIPPNIAPLNFKVLSGGDAYLVRISNRSGDEIIIKSGNGNIIIPENRWHKLLRQSGAGELMTDIFIKKDGRWEKFNTIKNFITRDSIDRFLAYRLIEPGYVIWKKMGIYQRDLEDFTESPVMLNSLSGNNCMNCHNFCMNNGNTMMFHMRGSNSGTIIFKNDTLRKVNTRTEKTISAGVYPAWHPSGNYIAFSVNNISQTFHSLPGKRIEVYDTLSDIIIYDVRKNAIFTSAIISDPDMLETFPSWSPGGDELYFCRAKRLPSGQYQQVRYDLYRIAFNQVNCTFGTKIDTVISIADKGKSISFPRVSPDGKFILYCLSDYGSFSIWHPESDLWLADLINGKISKPEINSNTSESYHSWSSDGRWIVFSSRRDDGLYTRPYFSWFDSLGVAHKPFLLPQKDPDFYSEITKSFNVPEMVRSKIGLNPRKIARQIQRIQPMTTFGGNR